MGIATDGDAVAHEGTTDLVAVPIAPVVSSEALLSLEVFLRS